MANIDLFLVLSFVGDNSYVSAPGSFIFSLENYYGLSPFKCDIYQNEQSAIQRESVYGPSFGSTSDLLVDNNAHISGSSLTYLGGTYKPPPGYNFGEGTTQALLSGDLVFTPNEVEVFYQE